MRVRQRQLGPGGVHARSLAVLTPGTRVDPWRVVGWAGQGGYGLVYVRPTRRPPRIRGRPATSEQP